LELKKGDKEEKMSVRGFYLLEMNQHDLANI